uniref:Uncharacterized protein n=1 Tax=Pseudo-nitzschia australis TaxID=44445 RepID=A0A7S4ENB1_9STRA|mmetsp:Transcript_5853/g.12713  ORF Transcript_5853/g.12713 Transcript_5853/m.12713 type:complete len:144 (+) Transcript_5853:356-787(+)|eukprot:CAMPEP_0168181692 /NCGR_PEP_ID=MMETSP0139_2-20121125/11404_1 /TAXON_ID=44445 /ORGANISM="Pseudo-nitzschia australis, Strain 10249 10 AB" /LENGTH=143 /DNA_ID=CAMNT_0008102389 /DNA_START=127 /DNA_END=558 /DNA_ORIENTATION=-
MLSSSITFALVLIVFAAVLHADAFTSTLLTPSLPSSALQAGRRDFLDAAISTTAGLAVSSLPIIAGAEEGADDLAMPSEEEQKKIDADAAAERLRRKAELQKQKSSPINFKDNLAKEREKQKGLQMSKEERRNALCEELGRGC